MLHPVPVGVIHAHPASAALEIHIKGRKEAHLHHFVIQAGIVRQNHTDLAVPQGFRQGGRHIPKPARFDKRRTFRSHIQYLYHSVCPSFTR